MASTLSDITSVTSPVDKTPTTWLEHTPMHEDIKLLNKVHNWVVNILKIMPKDVLSTDANVKILDKLIALNVNAILIKYPMEDKMMIIHQISKVCGDLINPKVEYFGLLGFRNKATKVKFCPKSILTINEVRVREMYILRYIPIHTIDAF